MLNIKKLTEGVLLLAFSVILTRFLSIKITLYGVEGVRIGFGVLPPLLAGEKEKISYLRIIFAVACTHFTVSLFSVPYFLKILFGIPYQATFLPRLVSFFLNVLTMNLVLLVLQTKINILDIDGVMVKG